MPKRQETRYADLDGWRIAYEEGGSGAGAIVFVHGATSSRAMWYRQMEGLDVGRRLVAVDLVGHGESDKPVADYSMDLLARSVAAVIEDLGIERGILVGHSNGVPTVRQFYRLFPERTEALVAVDGGLRSALRKEVVDWMRATLERPDFDDFQRQMVEQTPTGRLAAEDVAMIKAAALATPRHVMAAGLEAMTDPAIWTEDQIGVPLLAIHAANPQLWTDDYEDLVRRLAPKLAGYHVWDDVSHFLNLEQPDRFNGLLARFVAEVESGEILAREP